MEKSFEMTPIFKSSKTGETYSSYEAMFVAEAEFDRRERERL